MRLNLNFYYGLNEILGVAVLKDLGFLAPDTFE